MYVNKNLFFHFYLKAEQMSSLPPASTEHNPFFELDNLLFAVCGPYEQSTLSALFAYLRYAPYFIIVVNYTVSFWYKELYFLLFSIGLTIDGIINHALNEHFEEEHGAIRVESCPALWGSVIAYQVQHVAFYITFTLGYMLLYQPRAKLWHIALAFLFFDLVVIGAHFMNFHTSEAIVLGAIIGTQIAQTFQTLIHWCIIPYMPRILRFRLVMYFGYKDSLATADKTPMHIIILEKFDEEFTGPAEQNKKPLTAENVRQWFAAQTF